jgi:hypothetical protein
MKKFIKIAEVTENFRNALSEITPEQIKAMSVLDEDFNNAAREILCIFSDAFNEVNVASVPVVKTESSTKSDERHKRFCEEPVNIPDVNKRYTHPVHKNIQVTMNGEFFIDGVKRKITTHGRDKAVIRLLCKDRKEFLAGKLMYEAITGVVLSTGYTIRFKNNDPMDVRFDNLYPCGKKGRVYSPDMDPMINEKEIKNEELFSHPSIPNLKATKGGKIFINGIEKKPHISGSRLHVVINNRNYNAGKIIYESVTGSLIDKTHLIRYKNNNIFDLRFENLIDSERSGYNKMDKSIVQEICMCIAANPEESISGITSILSKKGIMTSFPGVKSVMQGNYSAISDKYFHVINGKIIPEKKEHKDVKYPINSSIKYSKPCQITIDSGDLSKGVEKFNEMVCNNETVTSEDKIIPILYYGADHTIEETYNILVNEYGDIAPSKDLIARVKSGEFGRAVLAALD